MNKIYNTLFLIGTLSGCHQRADRSFFLRGKQFPLCARCTGAFLGYMGGSILFLFYTLPLWVNILLCVIMFLDWSLQHFNILKSTNIRRILTGFLCGIGLIQIWIQSLIYLHNFILRIVDI